MRILDHLEPISGSFLGTLKASADAWAGGYSWRDPDNYDPDSWTGVSSRAGDWPDGEAVYIGRYGDVDLGFVRQNAASRLANRRDSVLSDGHYEEDPKAREHWYCFIAWSSENEEINEVLGLPITDGYLLVCGAFAQDDEFVPVMAEWHGRRIGKEELGRRVSMALDKISGVRIVPTVPAPTLPPDVLEWIRRARAGQVRGPADQGDMVESLLGLDRAAFLEAIDRLVPWMYGPEAPAAWMEKNEKLSGRAFLIKSETEGLTGRMRLCPWKSGIGNPEVRSIRVPAYPANDRVSVTLSRGEDGRFRVDPDAD